MPRIPINYQNIVIYKIVSNDLTITDVYIGSTTDFTKRKYGHKSNCNNINSSKYNFKIYQFIRDNGGWEAFTMIEIEKYPCNDSNEARSRERYQYELLNAKLNTICPIVNLEEKKEQRKIYKKTYKQNNKEKLKEQDKIYRQNNKEKIKTYYQNNKEQIKEQHKIYKQNKKENNNI